MSLKVIYEQLLRIVAVCKIIVLFTDCAMLFALMIPFPQVIPQGNCWVNILKSVPSMSGRGAFNEPYSRLFVVNIPLVAGILYRSEH